MRTRAITILGLLLAATGATTWAADRPAAGPSGFLYGTIETDSRQTHTGLLRWNTEESFWDDLFNSTKDEVPHLEAHERSGQRRREVRVFGFSFGYKWDDSRQFVARFGDIQTIEPLRGEKVRLTMKDGTKITVDGGSNDIGAKVSVRDDALGEVRIDWDRIERITFRATPASERPGVLRLYGVLTTRHGSFEGYVQWDSEECRSTDKLDGDSADGDVSIEMGKIRTIERRGRSGSRVVLEDGREFELHGSNDVDDSIRGILVEDPRYGRVKVSWDEFVRLELRSVDHSGRGYAAFPAGRPLRGTVTDASGRAVSGRIVFDLDEEWTWEMLDGQADGVEYIIPFALVRSIEPQRGDRSKIVLRAGGEIVLEDSHDVSEDNSGVLILGAGDRETFVEWDDVKRIDFDP